MSHRSRPEPAAHQGRPRTITFGFERKRVPLSRSHMGRRARKLIPRAVDDDTPRGASCELSIAALFRFALQRESLDTPELKFVGQVKPFATPGNVYSPGNPQRRHGCYRRCRRLRAHSIFIGVAG